MVFLNVDVNYDVYDYDEHDYVLNQYQHQLVYTDKSHGFYWNDYVHENEQNSTEMNFIRSYLSKIIKSYMIMFIMSKPMKKYF